MPKPRLIEIAPVDGSFADVLAEIHDQSFAESWDAAALHRLLEAPAAVALQAVDLDQAKTVGFVLAFAAAGEAEILSIAVAQDQRRHGIGGQLIDQLISQLRDDGTTRLFLEVAADNLAARGLYRQKKFSETGRRKGYYVSETGEATDALMLALEL